MQAIVNDMMADNDNNVDEGPHENDMNIDANVQQDHNPEQHRTQFLLISLAQLQNT